MTQNQAVYTEAGETDGASLLHYFPFLLLYRKAAQMQQSEEETSTDTSSQSISNDCPLELPRQF